MMKDKMILAQKQAASKKIKKIAMGAYSRDAKSS